MTWNYRILRQEEPEAAFILIEAHYNSKGEPWGWTNTTPQGETPEELIEDLETMLRDCKAHPPISRSDFVKHNPQTGIAHMR